MLDLIDPEKLSLIFSVVVPGLIIYFVRSKFITGRQPSISENILTYIVLSSIFYFLAFPFKFSISDYVSSPWIRSLAWFVFTILGPAILGIALGIFTQKQGAARIAELFDLAIVNVVPTAWDWRFSTIQKGGQFVLVTLNDGSSVAGYFGARSFASSEGAERDIYIEEEYDLSDDGSWSQRPSRIGILIPSKEIKHIEFWDQN